MNQITLRQIPEQTYKQLKNLAKKNHTSINKTVILLLNKSLGIEPGSEKKRDLSDIAGTWSKEEFDEIIVPVVVIGELLAGFYSGNKTDKNIKELKIFL